MFQNCCEELNEIFVRFIGYSKNTCKKDLNYHCIEAGTGFVLKKRKQQHKLYSKVVYTIRNLKQIIAFQDKESESKTQKLFKISFFHYYLYYHHYHYS